MNIQITKKFRIVTKDRMNIDVEEYRKGETAHKKVTIGWRFCGHYGSVEHALKAIARKKLLICDARTVKELLQAISETKAEILDSVSKMEAKQCQNQLDT